MTYVHKQRLSPFPMLGLANAHVAAVVVVIGIAGSAVLCRAADPTTCATCHADEADLLSGSVHTSLKCQECHGGPKRYELAGDELARYVNRRADDGVTFEHGEDFLGKPSRTQVPERCGNCHADVERMNPYGLRTDQLARYWTSGHGKALKKNGDTNVAVCVDCHGTHDIQPGHEPSSKTYPLNVPATCSFCHANSELMSQYDLPVEVVEEYRESVHGRLLFQQHDTGAPTCATCHGNHSATPPGFATVSAVCGQCHQHAEKMFAKSIHATLPGHKRCVQCHGGGEDRHDHYIERITKPPGLLIQRYNHLLTTEKTPTPERVTEAIHPAPKQILERALPTCLECHEDPEYDESIPKLFHLLDEIAAAERYYVETANRLDEVGAGVLLVENQRFKFEDAKTHLIELAPLQHTLNNDLVAAKVDELKTACDTVNGELDELVNGLRWRHRALGPIWVFAVLFAVALYAKYRQLRRAWVKPLPRD